MNLNKFEISSEDDLKITLAINLMKKVKKLKRKPSEKDINSILQGLGILEKKLFVMNDWRNYGIFFFVWVVIFPMGFYFLWRIKRDMKKIRDIYCNKPS